MIGPSNVETQTAGRSRFWSVVLSGYLRGVPTPLMRSAWRRNDELPFSEVIVVGRRSGRERRLLLNLIEVDGRRFIGHPNGAAQWTHNLAAARSCTLIDRTGRAERVHAREITAPADRDLIIEATTRLPAPTGRIYRAAGSHIRAAGRYFELTPAAEPES